jgi:N-acyl-D-aspartate/D-glutamate deacylase
VGLSVVTLDPDAPTFTVSAESRFSANSNEIRVRVDASKNRFTIVEPRSVGTFPRVLGRYVRERKALTLEDAIRKMTSRPAGRVKLADRGRIAVGMAADLVAFDPVTVIDQASFEDPFQYPTGIELVMVNGELALDRGTRTDARSGAGLRPA